jgi:hypothetical protein
VAKENLVNIYRIKRRYRRFDLQLPVHLSFPIGGTVRQVETISKNVSVGGMLLRAADAIPLHSQVNLTMDVRIFGSRRRVRLTSEGEVVRVEQAGQDGGFAIAIECKRPIKEIETQLSVAS